MPESWESNSRHNLIQDEFRQILENEQLVPKETDGVMVLSAPPSKVEMEVVAREQNPENRARITFGINVIKQIVSEKTGKSIQDLTIEDLQSGPLLLLNGDSEQIDPMKELALERDFPADRIVLLNAGSRLTANTKTQFEAVNTEKKLAGAKHITIITTRYHVPRVVRTADKNVRPDLDLTVLGVPFNTYGFNVASKAKGEIKKIIDYAKKGDVSIEPQRGKASFRI